MPPITRLHSLFPADPTKAALPQPGLSDGSQSRYCYLFPKLAAAKNVGCFAGTDAAGTFRRLQDFVEATQIPMSDMPVLRMRLPAVYTYFGQFVNHDISAPVGDVVTRPKPQKAVAVIGTEDPPGLDRSRRAGPEVILNGLLNEQPNPLTLDSLYGDGPDSADPGIAALYAADGKRFRLGVTRREADQVFRDIMLDPATVRHATGAPDLLRADGKPRIADHRNDENLILSQLHLALMLVHNKAVTALEGRFPDASACFAEARQLVTLHYHWLILHDFLQNLLSREVTASPLTARPLRLPSAGRVPLEFTSAAYRFGHSMVGSAYDFNENFGQDGKVSAAGATLMQLFTFTTHGNMGSQGPDTLQLPDHWVIDWDRMSRPPAANGIGGAEKIDMTFAQDMLNAMPMQEVVAHGSILFRNLMRGFQRRIPFGQALAREYGVDPLDEADLRRAFPGGRLDGPATPTLRDFAEGLGMMAETPAWLYFLCEARLRERGERVGPTASHIIADTITGLMRFIPGSVLNHAGGTWHPRQSPLTDGHPDGLVSIRQLLMFAVRDTGL